jgi:hypothetical protein
MGLDFWAEGGNIGTYTYCGIAGDRGEEVE